MTRAQHIALGALLGFPECCVSQWVDELSMGGQALRRGGITERIRSREECETLLPAIHALGVDWTLDDMLADARVCYVPCDACALREALRLMGVTDVTVWAEAEQGTTELSTDSEEELTA